MKEKRPPLPAGEGGGEGRLLPLPAGEGRGEGHPLRILRARDLREHSTRAERLLWRHLRDRGLAGAKFRRQHPVGEFVADFCAVEEGLAVELDGGQHARPEDERRDVERTRLIEGRGYRVLRFWNLDVLENVEVFWR